MKFFIILTKLYPGLNLGLMSLDQTELKIVMNTGTIKEKDYAKVLKHQIYTMKLEFV